MLQLRAYRSLTTESPRTSSSRAPTCTRSAAKSALPTPIRR